MYLFIFIIAYTLFIDSLFRLLTSQPYAHDTWQQTQFIYTVFTCTFYLAAAQLTLICCHCWGAGSVSGFFLCFGPLLKYLSLGCTGGKNNNRKGGAEREHIIRRKAWKEIAAKCNKTYCPRVWLVLENNTPAAGRLQHITITTPSEFMVSGNQQKVSTLNHAAKGPARTS